MAKLEDVLMSRNFWTVPIFVLILRRVLVNLKFKNGRVSNDVMFMIKINKQEALVILIIVYERWK